MTVDLKPQHITVDLERIATARERLLVFQRGPVDEQLLKEAKEHGFDHAPVVDECEQLIGIIPVAHVKELSAAGQPIEPDDPQVNKRELPARMPMLDFLDEIGTHRAAVIRDTEQRHQDEWFAFVTLSDLNRHAFRAYLYPLFARLESELAQLIDWTFEDPWTWIPWTPQHNRPTIVGRWMLDQKKNIDTGPLSGCMLSDLFAVVRQSKEIRRHFCYDTEELNKMSRSFEGLRNDVMHPVRPLVHTTKMVTSLRERLEALLDFTDRVAACAEDAQRKSSRSARFRR